MLAWRERRAPTAAAPAAVLAAVLILGGCAGEDVTAPPETAASPEAVSRPTTSPPMSAGPPHETELSPGWDQSPDGPSPTPDSRLSDVELTRLLRTRASDTGDPASCGADEVTARLSGMDAALGHRYTSLVVENTSSRACVVEGVPGLGARGDWGNRLTVVVEPGTSITGAAGPVRLAPGGQARALVEWTGELAGHGSERASLLVVQLAAGQVPVALPARIDAAPDGSGGLDVGMFTTIRIGPFEPPDRG